MRQRILKKQTRKCFHHQSSFDFYRVEKNTVKYKSIIFCDAKNNFSRRFYFKLIVGITFE